MTASIVGWAHTPFGKHELETLESLIVRGTREAHDHAGIGPEDVGEVVLGGVVNMGGAAVANDVGLLERVR